jgi:hypothetical protein
MLRLLAVMPGAGPASKLRRDVADAQGGSFRRWA